MSLSLCSKLQPTSFFKASRWPRGPECHIESRSLVLICLSLGGWFGIMDGLRWVPKIEFSELRMMSVIAQSGWGCASCPWRCVCVCVCVCVCHGWLGTCGLMCSVLLQFNRFCINSLLSLCQSITSIHSVMLLFLFIHFFFCTRSQLYLFLSFLWNCPSTVILLCHPLSYSFIWVFFHSLHLSRSLISLSLFHIVLQSYQTGLTYIHTCRRDPFQKRLLLPRQQIFSLQILQGVVTAHLRVKCCCQPFVRLNVK